MVTDEGLLYIEPKNPPSERPLVDELTGIMAAALEDTETGVLLGVQKGKPLFKPGGSWRGFHICSCGAVSDSQDFRIRGSDIVTNSLCVHYLAYHRDEIPQVQLETVRTLPYGPVLPSKNQLWGPKRPKTIKKKRQ